MSRLALGAVIALVAAAAACSSPEERFARHLARAEELVREHRIEDALLELQSALKVDPGSAEANQRIAEILAEQGAAATAVVHFGEAYRLDPSRVEAAMRQAALLAKDQPQRAARIVERAKQAHPEAPVVFRTESALALAAGEHARALESARRATSLDPQQRESWIALGAVQRALAMTARESGEPIEGPLAEALESYARADSLAGGDVGARVARARILASWPGREAEAVAEFRSAIDLATERGDADGRRVAALALEQYARRRADLPLAREALRHAVAVAPERLTSWERLAAVSEQLEGPDAAEAVLRELVSKWPNSAAAHASYAAHVARSGRGAEAIAHLDRTIDGGLDDPLLWEQLVRLELARGKTEDARARLRELAERHGDDPIARRTQARVALAEGRRDGALEILRDLAAEGADAETEALRAQVELEAGHVEAAKAAALRAARAPGFSLPIQRLLAAIHGEAREWTQALAALERIERHGLPLGPDDLLVRARSLYGRGERAAARAALTALLARPDAPPDAAVVFAQEEGASDPAEARAHLERALARAPANFAVLEALTRIDLGAGAHEGALERIDRVVAAHRTGARVALLRAEVLARAGRFEQAEADALRAFEAAPDLPRAVDLLYAIYAAQGKLDEVRRSFEEAEAAGVLHGGARVLLARLYLARGDAERARATYERVVAENPEIAPAKNDLAFMLASRGEQLERALALAEAADRALPDSANAADTLGYVCLRLGRLDAAVAHLRRALARAASDDPSRPTFHYHLALALAERAETAEAALHFERALALDPDFPGAAAARERLASLRADDAAAQRRRAADSSG